MSRKELLQRLLGKDAPPVSRQRQAVRPDAPRQLPAPAVTRVPLSRLHGCSRLADVWPVQPDLRRLARLPVDLALDPEHLLFLDTETTGLAGGTGTYIFLAGLARVEPRAECLTVRQYLLPDPALESLFLQAVLAECATSGLIVCFNGKTYDLPLLQTRLVMNRFEADLSGTPVLDLLHPARRCWREAVGSCTQQNLERAVIGFQRQGDCPGAVIPEMYFRYLRERDPGILAGVLQHNLLDMIGMAALLALLNRRFSSGSEPDGQSLLPLLRALLDQGRLEEFRQLLSERGDSLDALARRHAGLGKTLARLYKRSGLRESGYQLSLFLSRHRPRQALEAMHEVLLHEEHVARDYALALAHCEEFLALSAGWPEALAWRAQFERRRLRLQAKQNRHRKRPG